MLKDFGNNRDGYHTGEEMPWTGDSTERKPRPGLEQLELDYNLQIEIDDPLIDKLITIGEKLKYKIIDPKKAIPETAIRVVDEVVLIYLETVDGNLPISMFGIRKNKDYGLKHKREVQVFNTESLIFDQNRVKVIMDGKEHPVGYKTLQRSASTFKR